MSESANIINNIRALLPKALPADRRAIGHEITGLNRSKNGFWTDEKKNRRLMDLQKKLQASVKRRSWRIKHLPSPVFNPILPITAKKDEIIDAIKRNQVIIISGETGSGKTTQIPKFCLAAGRGIDGKIGCTQPRRIAAVTVARRISEELGEALGESVGYKIRFTDKSSRNSFIKIMTDGVLLAETQGDPYLSQYDTIIVDEAHERSLNIDFILGILKGLLIKRKDLKVIITSATIDTTKFSKAFDNAPVIEVSGRMYPVEVRYDEAASEAEKIEEQNYVDSAADAVDRLQKESPFGDILVFMPTEQDIRELCELIEGRKYKSVTVLPLFSRLSDSEQSRIFSNIAGRKIIVATNIAETSITIPGIRYVIDTGLARIPSYNPRSRTTSLAVMPVSRSSADQRKGRCGRVENGICIRLFSGEDFLTRPLFTPPEILRANLAEVILRMTALKLGNVSDFPFIDGPASKNIKDGYDLLLELGAMIPADDGKKRSKGANRFLLTENGRLMSKIPLDPRLSRMLIEARKEGCLREISIIASALSLPDPRQRPVEKIEEADRIHATFNDPSSDFATLLTIWEKYHDSRQDGKKNNSLKRFCKSHYLSYKRMKEWCDIHGQISEMIEEYGFNRPLPAGSGARNISSEPSDYGPGYAAIHKSILSGFLSNIAVKKEKNIFNAARGKQVMVFPGSSLFNKAKTWIVAAEMVETSRIYARTVANIDCGWLEDLGKAQCKYAYMNPHWERNRGEVVASEQVSLFGLVIIPQRPVSFGRVHPEEAAEIFIRSALVEGDMRRAFPFMKYNRGLIDEIKDMENRMRRRDLLVSEQYMFQFYKERLGGIFDIRSLQKYVREMGGDAFLRMKKEDLLLYFPDERTLHLYPDRLSLGDRSFPCAYRFEPGENDDGVTVRIPSASFPVVRLEPMDWLVPGLLREKITELIKGLPKAYRRRLVPVASTVDTILKEMHRGETPLTTELGKFIFKRYGVDIPASAWPLDALPEHLKIRVSVIGPEGKELCSGRDTNLLNRNVAGQIPSDQFESVRKHWEKTGLTKWDFGDLPQMIHIRAKSRAEWIVYPGLEPAEKSVNLRLFHHSEEALESHKKGVASLFSIYFSKDLRFLKKNLILSEQMKNWADYFGGSKRFEKKLYESVIKDLFCRNIRTKDAFYSHAEAVAPDILKSGQEKLNSVFPVLKAYHESRSTLYNLETANRNRGLNELFGQLRLELCRLVPESFQELYDPERLIHIERYIKAISIRAQRAFENFAKDRVKAEELKDYTDRLNRLLNELSGDASEEKKNATEEYFWLIEEYKVSLFAQELKTPFPVSKKRLDEKLKEIERMT